MKVILSAALVLSVAGCGTLTGFGEQAGDAFDGAEKRLFEKCQFFVTSQETGYVTSKWGYCGEIEAPDKIHYRRYDPAAIELAAMVKDAAGPIPFAGQHTVHKHEASRALAGTQVEWLHMTLVSNERSWKHVYAARADGKHYVACVVNEDHAYEPQGKPRTKALLNCQQAIEAILTKAL